MYKGGRRGSRNAMMLAPMYPALSRWRKLVFSLVGFSRGVVWGSVQLFLSAFLLEVVKMPPTYAAIVIWIKQSIDAISDPLIGAASDYTNTRLGRRKPWYLATAVPVVGLWMLMWSAPGWIMGDDGAQFGYYMAVVLLFSLAYTAFSMPMQALIPDASPTYDERISVVMYFELMSKVGTLMATFAWSSLLTTFPDEEENASLYYEGSSQMSPDQYNYARGYILASLVSGPIIVLTALIGALSVKERPLAQVTAARMVLSDVGTTDEDADFSRSLSSDVDTTFISDSSTAGLGSATLLKLKNVRDNLEDNHKRGLQHFFVCFTIDMWELLSYPPFMYATCINLFTLLGVTYFVNNFYLWMKYVIMAEDMSNWVLLTLQVSVVISFIFWAAVTKLVDKSTVYVSGAIPWILTSIALFFMNQDNVIILFPLIAVRGFLAGAGYLLPGTMLPDVIALDELRCGKRREALFYSLFLLMLKLAMAFSGASSTLVLGWCGYVPPPSSGLSVPQPDAVLWALRTLACLLPVLMLFLASVCAWRYHHVVKKAEQDIYFSQNF